MSDSVFRDRDAVAAGLHLPNVVSYCVIGPSTPRYQALVHTAVERLAGGDGNIRSFRVRQSPKGGFAAYHYDIFQLTIEEVEETYRELGAIEGTRMIL